MKKTICLLLAMYLVFSLSGCGRKSEAAPQITAVPVTPEATVVPADMPTVEPAPPHTAAPEPVPEEPLPEGETEVPSEPEPAPTASVPVGPPVVITKNPTSESLAIGGKTWFIAHADNALSLTWQLVDPTGAVFSLEEAIAVNPGLQLEALEGDTIAVSNVPISLNGWGVQARFDGEGNYAVTEPAYVYVGDFVSAYSSVFNKYLQTRTDGTVKGLEQYAAENDIGVFAVNAASIGYALKDLDKNGIPELILAGTSDPAGERTIGDLYTLVNNEPVNIARSYARVRYHVLTNNMVFLIGASGASYIDYEAFRLTGSVLETVEMVFTDYDAENLETIYFYKQGHSDTRPDENSVRISREECDAWVKQMEDLFYIPPLTKIY